MQYAQQLITAIRAGVEAGRAIVEVYESDFAVETKDDQSPLTLADQRSHDIIQTRLAGTGIPVISEEGKAIPYAVRKAWQSLWIVDPLDGTKEFVKRNGEFTVNIALIEKQQPVLGVVYAPIAGGLYFASTQIGAFKLTNVQSGGFDNLEAFSMPDPLQALMDLGTRLPVGPSGNIYTIVGSRSHGTPELEAFVENKRQEKGRVEFIVAGSSLKICLVAEGAADIYPRLGPTMEWDTAAGQAVAQCAGARVYVHGTNEDLRYNREDMLNPWFIVER
jgi:3'(2'), 5'-bisphosphate nucleotidase